MTQKKNRVYLIVGPSGVGKNTLLDDLLLTDPTLQSAISVTTRAPRPGEVHGVHYYYISQNEFKAHTDQHELLQYVHYAGNYYGLLNSEIDNKLAKNDVFCIVEPDGVRQLKEIYPDAISVFLNADPDVLKARMIDRGDSSDTIDKRMSTYQHFMKYLPEADHIITSLRPGYTLKEMLDIMDKYK